MRSGFASLIGRPNVGKSTLLNAILGAKVSIVSNKAQTTRTAVRGVLNRPGAQLVWVDTPGIHKPRTLLGERLNATATAAVGDVDVVVAVLDASAPIGRGDRFVVNRLPPGTICALTKIDSVAKSQMVAQLMAAGALDLDEYFPVSGRTGAGVEALVDAVISRLPEGPQLYPDDMITDVSDAFWVAELVREQLLAVMREEVPHSIACRVTEWDWPHVRCEILVERDSQKGIVIGRGGAILKEVGTLVRSQLEPGAFIELFVRVDKDWQSRPKALERLGY